MFLRLVSSCQATAGLRFFGEFWPSMDKTEFGHSPIHDCWSRASFVSAGKWAVCTSNVSRNSLASSWLEWSYLNCGSCRDGIRREVIEVEVAGPAGGLPCAISASVSWAVWAFVAFRASACSLKCPYHQNFYCPIWFYVSCNEHLRKNISIWIKSDFVMNV